MPSTIDRIFGFNEASSGRRPQMAEFTGINWSKPTAYNMLVCLPMWETTGVPTLDLGPLHLIGPDHNVLRTQDTYFGDVYYGDNTGADQIGPIAGGRGYNLGYVSELNFGRGPSPFSLTFWFKVLSVNFSPANDVYLMTFDDTGQTNFPGFAVSFDTGSQIAVNTNNTNGQDPNKSPAGVGFDGNWHHLAFSHIPGTAGGSDSINTYFIDGIRVATYNTAHTIGPVNNTTNFYIGTDDNGSAQPFGGYFCDLRIYKDALSDDRAAAMYHPDTRWEIYAPPSRAFFLPVPPPPPPPPVRPTVFVPANLTVGAGGPFFVNQVT